MIDMENVIKKAERIMCSTVDRNMIDSFCEDVIDLLKDHEAVEPKVSSTEQRCGNCNKVIEMDGWKVCPWCGKMIDWERWWSKNGNR